jgi:hypothetical protein
VTPECQALILFSLTTEYHQKKKTEAIIKSCRRFFFKKIFKISNGQKQQNRQNSLKLFGIFKSSIHSLSFE